MLFAVPAYGKLGETVPQLVKRLGGDYTVERERNGERYKFRSANVTVDVFIGDRVSVGETYYSDHPLTSRGEPPNEVVQAILATNVPGTRWMEIPATPLGAEYAMQSYDRKYIAVLKYGSPQPENAIWIMTVARSEYLLSALPKTVEGAPNLAAPPPATTAAPSATPAATPTIYGLFVKPIAPDATPPPPPYGIYGGRIEKHGDEWREPLLEGGYYLWRLEDIKGKKQWMPYDYVPPPPGIKS